MAVWQYVGVQGTLCQNQGVLLDKQQWVDKAEKAFYDNLQHIWVRVLSSCCIKLVA